MVTIILDNMKILLSVFILQAFGLGKYHIFENHYNYKFLFNGETEPYRAGSIFFVIFAISLKFFYFFVEKFANPG